jgi:predicted helicase
MTTIYDVLDDLRSRFPENRERGDAFERLTQRFLTTDPLYASRFTKVWLWQEWPDRKGKVDTGIDLVAETVDGFAAVQCKFYDEHHPVSKEDIDTFLSASGKHPFTERLVVSTTDKWSNHAEDALSDQQVPVARIGVADLNESAVDWSAFQPKAPSAPLTLAPKKKLRPHQTAALTDVFKGFETSDRGKLIMACGTGKTFTALKAAERVASEAPTGRATVLFLVPSISLLNQTLREWTAETELPIRSFAVCSDTKVGKRSANEDIRIHDLDIPATTDSKKLAAAMSVAVGDVDLTVVFSTYQSIDAVAAAQAAGVPTFDLIVCDEAHRTTGATLTGEDESAFVKVHDSAFLLGTRRLYMTATPRLFSSETKVKATEHDALLCSMDDEKLYGPEFHRLGFGKAVEAGLLSDYKVLVLNVDEEHIARSFQMQLADENFELGIEDAARIVGCWNGLAKRGTTIAGDGFGDDLIPMRRAVAFSRSIKDSKAFATRFPDLIHSYTDGDPELLRCELAHVDGTDNALIRNERLAWLKAKAEPGVCRILSNARCLSEGVDVPELDAVLFLNPRNSEVDVVQSVGRVMRRAEGKTYGYIILPVAIPSGMEPSVALRDNKRYRVVWQVLQALRAHDDRFNAMVNQIELNKTDPKQIDVIGIPGGAFGEDGAPRTSVDDDREKFTQRLLDFDISDWRDAIYARIVTKVGERTYWEQWADDIRVIAERHVTRINVAIAQPENAQVFAEFVEELRSNLNPGIRPEDAVDMLAQHLITKPVFDALFGSYQFSEHNPIAVAMADMLTLLQDATLENEATTLNKFYDQVRVRAEGIDNHEGRQRVITELYERFFKKALPKAADAFGIVYTPIEIVDFIIRAVNDALNEHFHTDLSAEGVQILDPFTGTGTFIVRVLQSGFIRPTDLLRKYTAELHANEILLLAYYIAAVNIEATFDQLDSGDYTPFEGIVLTDTFQLAEDTQTLEAVLFPENNKRVKRQKAQDIRVIIGNPPYSVGQTSQNENNQNQSYPALDGRITETYSKASSAGLSKSMYDSYIRAFRWATDRLRADGIVCFVSNGGWLGSNSADGFRKTLASEYDHIYVFNLRGNGRGSGEPRRKEKDNVFKEGTRSTIAITLLIRTGGGPGCTVHYHDIGDYLSRHEKLAIISDASLASLPWVTITPNEQGDWTSVRDANYGTYTILGSRARKGAAAEPAIFDLYSPGVVTNRDAWCWNFSSSAVEANTSRMVTNYNEEAQRFARHVRDRGIVEPTVNDVKAVVDSDPRTISWTRSMTEGLRRGHSITHDPTRIVTGAYRPFAKQHLYFDRSLVEVVSQQVRMFPDGDHPNIGICLTGTSSHFEFACIMAGQIPDLHLLDTGQFFPRYRYTTPQTAEEESLFANGANAVHPERVDNISDFALSDYRALFGDDVSKDDIFFYVYGLLHSAEYRERYAADLAKALPRIPKVAGFREFAEAGSRLAALHLGYETVEPFGLQDPSTEPGFSGSLRVQKMRFASGTDKGTDRTRVVYNGDITLAGIPEQAYDYMLGPRSALEWVMDRYQVKADKGSGIVNDPNAWCDEVGDPRYIVDLVKRVVTVSLETMRIVDGLPPLDVVA